jgi:parallel beta-helix repeat protein
MIMNIPGNVYNIQIDDHLEAVNANFTGTGVCTQIHRIIINGTSPALQPVAYFDDVEVRRCVVIPEDFPTIQGGINAANPGDTVFVKKGIYFENVTISKNVCLVGEDRNATIIDGRFIKTEGRTSNVISVFSNNVTIYGFTIRNAEANGVFVGCLNNTITDNIILFSLGCGIYLIGSNLTVTNNVIESNGDCGIRIAWGQDNLVRTNIIENNGVGLRCDEGTADNLIYQNRFVNNSRQYLDYGSNMWDDGYPYKPKEEKGGGNYWSDFICVDVYSGVSQHERGPSCSPSPDGICDAPYGKDRYPLFLIQNITQKPAPTAVTYETDVKVNATMLKDVEVEEAKIYVYFDSNRTAITMKKTIDDVWTGTIPRKPYGTQVRYNVSARAYSAAWLNSTANPLTAPYDVGDTKPPNIDGIKVIPSSPNENQTITISVMVTEPVNASGVDKVLLSYNFSSSVWKTQMVRNGTTNQYTGAIPKQPGGKPFYFVIEAFDKAGNYNKTKPFSTDIKRLAQLSLELGTTTQVAGDPLNVDFGVMSKGDTATNKDYTIWNRGNQTLKWQIVLVKPNAWFTITPMNGTIAPKASTGLTITVNTKNNPDPGLCVGEFSIKANGTKIEWTIITRVTVRYLVVDDSWASSETPNRCDVNSTQYYAFHVIWAHNSSDATTGTITISGVTGAKKVNATGWANFNYSSKNPIKKTFSVQSVNFTYVYAGKVYYIKAFIQKAYNLTTIWDRVRIILSIADDRIDVGSNATISWGASVYEFDNSSFTKFKGYPLLNDTLMHDTVGKWYFTTSSIVDPKYHLRAFRSNTVSCIWDEIDVIVGGVSRLQLDVGQTGTIWFTAIYRYDNKLFKGADGTLRVNVSEGALLLARNEDLNWSADKEVWTGNYTFTTPGTRTFTISRIEDRTYNLTRIKDKVGPLSMMWGPIPWWQAWWPQGPATPTGNQSRPNADQSAQDPHVELYPIWPLLIVIVAVGIIMVITLMMFLKSAHKLSWQKSPKYRRKIENGWRTHLRD